MSEPLTTLERSVLEMLLAGENPDLEILRNQLARVLVTKRELTGRGFFTHLALSGDLPCVPKRARITLQDVSAQLPQLKNGAGFILFVEQGAINCLEGFSYDEEWPETIDSFSLSYLKQASPGGGTLLPIVERDLNFALRDFVL